MVLIVEIRCDSRVDHARSFVFLGIFESYVPPCWILRFNSIGSTGTGAKYCSLEMLCFITWHNYNCSQLILQSFGFFLDLMFSIYIGMKKPKLKFLLKTFDRKIGKNTNT